MRTRLPLTLRSLQKWMGLLVLIFALSSAALPTTLSAQTAYLVGEGAGNPQKFIDAYTANGGETRLGRPIGLVSNQTPFQTWETQFFQGTSSTGEVAIIYNNHSIVYPQQVELRRDQAYVVTGNILQKYRNGDNTLSGMLGPPISDELMAPSYNYVAKTGKPIQYFERGMIGQSIYDDEYVTTPYYPSICGVDISVSDGSDNLVKITASAQVDRKPGWPQADDTTDPVSVYLVFVTADNTAMQLELTDPNPTVTNHFGGEGELPLPRNQQVNFFFMAQLRNGGDPGTGMPHVGTYPINAVLYEPWSQISHWAAPKEYLGSFMLRAGRYQPANDNWLCQGGVAGGPGSGTVKLPPIAEAGGDHQGVPIGRMTVNAGDPIMLNGGASYDPDGPRTGAIKQYTWKIIGTPPGRESELGQTYTSATADWHWKQAGKDDLSVWRFELEVTDDEGQTATDQIVVTVREGDRDGDGLADTDESKFGFNPDWADTDQDGLLDGEEVALAAYLPTNSFFPQYRRFVYDRHVPLPGTIIAGAYAVSPGDAPSAVQGSTWAPQQHPFITPSSSLGITVPGPKFGAGFNPEANLQTGTEVNLTLDAHDFQFENGSDGSGDPIPFSDAITLHLTPKVAQAANQVCKNFARLSANINLDLSVRVQGAFDQQMRRRSEPGFTLRWGDVAVKKGISGQKSSIELGYELEGYGAKWKSGGGWEFQAHGITFAFNQEGISHPLDAYELVKSPDGQSFTLHFSQELVETKGLPFFDQCTLNSSVLKIPFQGSSAFAANGLDTLDITVKGTIDWKINVLGVIQSDSFTGSTITRIQSSNTTSMYNGHQPVIKTPTIPAGASSEQTLAPKAAVTPPLDSMISKPAPAMLPRVTNATTRTLSGGSWTEALNDTDADGKANFLSITGKVMVNTPGNYVVRGTLTDMFGHLIRLYSTQLTVTTPATTTINLLFDGVAIGENNVHGPYHLATLDLAASETGENIAHFENVYTTAAYPVSLFQNGTDTDTTPPTTAVQIHGDISEYGSYTSPVTVTFTSADDQTGVYETQCRLNSGTWDSCSSPMTISTEGTTVLEVRSIDNVGNIEQPQVFRVNIAYLCYTMTDDDVPPDHSNGLVSFIKTPFAQALIGSTRVKNIKALSFKPGSNLLFAATKRHLGTIDLNTGQFTPTARSFGQARRPKSLEFDSVSSIAFDQSTGHLYGIQGDENSSQPDALFAIDQATGSYIPNVFGLGIDYLPLKGLKPGDHATNIAISPFTGQMYASIDVEGDHDRLVAINKLTGTTEVMGILGIDDLEGLSFTGDRNLYGIGDNKGTSATDYRVFQIDINSGTTAEVKHFAEEHNYDGLACRTGSSIVTAPTVSAVLINGGAADTGSREIAVTVTASPGAIGNGAWMFLIEEYELRQQQWVSVHRSEWLKNTETPMDLAWKITRSPGVHALAIWAADSAGNVSPLPSRAFINYTPSTAVVNRGKAHVYYYPAQIGEQLTIRVTPINGNPDLTLWRPDDTTQPFLVSSHAEGADEISFVAPVSGLYRIEVNGVTTAKYHVDSIRHTP